MASSVARMPREDWRDPHRLSVFGPHTRSLKKILVRETPHVPIPSTSSSTSTSLTGSKDAANGSFSRSASSSSSSSCILEDTSSPGHAKRRQSQILDRWAARQAREMITTIERQAHEAELSALTTSTQPVAARAASFLRETSPALSDTSTVSANPSCSGSGIDLPPNVRASSLIQMWRELEAEAGSTPTHYAAGGGGNSANTNPSSPSSSPTSVTEENMRNSDLCNEDLWYSYSATPASSEPVHNSSSGDGEHGRVGCIVKMLTSANKIKNNENECLIRENLVCLDREESISTTGSPGLKHQRVRGRGEIEELVARMEQDRKRELKELVERQAVSHFSYRGRLQSMLRLRFLRREAAVQDEARNPSKLLKQEQLQNRATISFLRQKFNFGIQLDDGAVHVEERSSSVHESEGSGYPQSTDHMMAGNDHNAEIVSSGDLVAMSEITSPHARSNEQEGSHSPDSSWDERNLWMSSIDWQRSVNSVSPVWQGEVAREELESYEVGNNDRPWLCDSPNSWRGLGLSQQTLYHDLFEDLSDNMEIRDLLERRRVSTSLASDFRDKMNRLVLSFLHRQGQQEFDHNFAENYETQPLWRQNNEFQIVDQVPCASSSLVPFRYQTFQHPDSSRYTSIQPHESQNLLDMEIMHDVRSDMQQIHHDIRELRKLLESCMDWQAKLQHSIKQEVCDAVREAVGMGNASSYHNLAVGKNKSCCICYAMQVDSLLYRCGHMCTCYKCAYELQWSSGKCPICRSPIDDVVRAYPNS